MDNRKFVRLSVIISCAAAVIVSVFACVLWLNLPSIYEHRIASLSSSGRADEAMDKLEELQLIAAEELDPELQARCRYYIADGMFRLGRYTDARYLFSQLGEHSDSTARVTDCLYHEAVQLHDGGMYADAARMFLSLGAYSDSRTRYADSMAAVAEQHYAEGDPSEALVILLELGDHPGARERAFEIAFEITGSRSRAEEMISGQVSAEDLELIVELELIRDTLPSGRIAAGRSHSAVLMDDGTVIAAGSNASGQCRVEQWTDITSLCAGADFTLGLRSDGTVIAAGDNSFGQCNVQDWTDVVSIAAGDYDAFAVTSDGRLLTAGYHDYSELSALEGVADIFAGSYQAVCLLEDGSAVSSHASASVSGKPLSVALTSALAVSLMPDGSLVSDFDAIPQWERIVALDANGRGILALTAEGTVNSFFFRDGDRISFGIDEGDIITAVAAGSGHYLLLSQSGRVYAFGDDSFGQCKVDGVMLSPQTSAPEQQ